MQTRPTTREEWLEMADARQAAEMRRTGRPMEEQLEIRKREVNPAGTAWLVNGYESTGEKLKEMVPELEAAVYAARVGYSMRAGPYDLVRIA